MEFIKSENTVIFTDRQGIDLDRTFNCGQCFRWDKKDEGYTGFAREYPCYVCVKDGALVVKCLTDVQDGDKFCRDIKDYFAMDLDYNMIKEKFSTDPVMKQAVAYAPGIRVLNQPFFEMLLTFIISRNNNIPRIKKIVDAMAEKYGVKKGGLYAFPTRQRLKNVSIEEYAELRMGFRAKYIFDAVTKVLSGEIDGEKIADMDTDRARKYLMQVKGVGPKVADCILLFSCKKYDCLPKDVWINRALRQMFPEGLPECIQGLEGIAQQYIFQYSRFNLEK